MPYISPDDFLPGVDWDAEERAYDGEVGAGHFTWDNGAGWSGVLELLLPSTIISDKIKVYAENSQAAGRQIRVKVYFTLYGNWYWTTVYTGTFNNGDWTEIDLPLFRISKIRLELYSGPAGNRQIHEVQMWEVEPSAPGYGNCVGLWRMNDNAANKDVVDYSNKGNDGTAFQNTDQVSVAGKIKTALDFDGTTDEVNCGNDASLQLEAEPFSFVIWINPDVWVNYDCVLGKANAAWDEGWMLYYAFNSLRFVVGHYLNDFASFSFDKVAGWYCVIGTFDGTNIKLYVDMSEAGTGDTGALVDPADDFVIGAWDPDYNFNGQIDVTILFNKVLSHAEMAWVFNETNGREHLNSARPLVGGSLTGKRGLVS